MATGNDERRGVPVGLPVEDVSARLRELAGSRQSLIEALAGRAAGEGSAEEAARADVSDGQASLWLIDQMSPGDPVYNMPLGLRLRGRLSAEWLQAALNDVVARHESLRSSFTAIEGRPRLVVRDPLHVPLQPIDLPPSANPEGELTRLAVQETARGFDLRTPPLMRAVLVRIAEDDHALLLSFHHSIFDGHSLGLFLRELSHRYRARSGEAVADLPPAPQYRDFTRSQQRLAHSTKTQAAIEHARRSLAEPWPVANLPLDHPRPRGQTFNGGNELGVLSPALVNQIEQLARQERVTHFMVMLAAWAVLLHRYCRQDDLLLGAAAGNRAEREFQQVLGLLANNLVLRLDLSGDPSFRTVLSRVRQVALQSYMHQAIPFERLLDLLNVREKAGGKPVFQAYFNYIDQSAHLLDLPGVRCSLIEVLEHGAKQELTCFYLRGEQHRLMLNYNRDLFDPDTIRRMLESGIVLLHGIASQPDVPISRLPLLGDDQLQLLRQWNQTRADYRQDKCVHDLVAEQALQHPGKTAISFGDESLTYGELLTRSERVSRRLTALGVGPGSRVGVMVQRGLEMPAALLGVMRAGAAYVPIDPGFPRQRIEMMLEDSGMAVLLTHRALLEESGKTICKVVCLDDLNATEPASDTQTPIPLVDPSTPAYVIYTSGSTGRPKGVVVSHRALVNFLQSMQQLPGCTDSDTLLAVTTLSFDIAGLELFLPLVAGGQVAIASRDAAADGAALLKLIERHRITILQATPATWWLLIRAGWKGTAGLKILCGGEPLPRELADELLQRGACVWNMYGPTETTIWSTVHEIQPGAGAISIGRPIANTQIHILDAHRQPVPIGVAGELYIAGDGLAEGYLNNPELTAERFVPNPFADVPGARMYRSGDLARWRADGTLECLGRVDHQVKVRGFRIELGEVESCLAGHPAVRQAVAAVRDGAAGDATIIGYYVPEAQPVSASELRQHLRQTLPDYMIPTAFVSLERIPLTPNGKVDRKALPSPDGVELESARVYAAPQTPTQQALAEIWGGVLRAGRIGLHDNFFDLGGHSLLATRIVARMRETLGVDLRLRQLFEAPTVSELAEVVEQARKGDTAKPASPALVPLARRGRSIDRAELDRQTRHAAAGTPRGPLL